MLPNRTPFRPGRCVVAAALGLLACAAVADGRDHHGIEARLKGYDEIPAALSTTGSGRFKASLDRASGSLHYELSYSGLEGNVTMAHLHFGRRGVNGGIMVWLCQTATNPDPSGVAPSCPASGSVHGMIQSSSVIGPAGQGIAPGEFAELLAAIRAGAVYANVHSSKYPGGEIRGQVKDDD
jgi:CHRD domain